MKFTLRFDNRMQLNDFLSFVEHECNNDVFAEDMQHTIKINCKSMKNAIGLLSLGALFNNFEVNFTNNDDGLKFNEYLIKRGD